MDGWVGRMDGWMDGWIDGWMDGWTDSSWVDGQRFSRSRRISVSGQGPLTARIRVRIRRDRRRRGPGYRHRCQRDARRETRRRRRRQRRRRPISHGATTDDRLDAMRVWVVTMAIGIGHIHAVHAQATTFRRVGGRRTDGLKRGETGGSQDLEDIRLRARPTHRAEPDPDPGPDSPSPSPPGTGLQTQLTARSTTSCGRERAHVC